MGVSCLGRVPKKYLNSDYLGCSYFHRERHELLEKMKRANKAVSEILGTILLLMIAVSCFTVLYYFVLSAPAPTPGPIVEISGTIDENHIILMHRGGETLSLDTEIFMTIGGNTESMTVGDFLDNESKEDGVWGLGEKVVYPVVFDFDYLNYPQADIMVVDVESNSAVLIGIVDLNPVCDLSIEMTVDNQFPKKDEYVVFTITATNNGDINASGVEIEFILPEELIHYSNTTTQGIYNNDTGSWDVGNLTPGQSVVLKIKALVGDTGSSEPTQLALVLDGSSSINKSDWILQIEGLAKAIEDKDTFPHDDRVELTVIQFGGGHWYRPAPGYAQVEIGPIIINETNVATVKDDINSIGQMGMYTPTACGILLAADAIVASPNNPSNGGTLERQVIMLVTDGNPNRCCDNDGDHQSDSCGSETAKTSAEAARNYLISTLGMTADDQDEFNAIAIGESVPHAPWLKENIVWPEPGYYAPPFIIDIPTRGWLRNVTTWEEFADSIDESFGIIFGKIIVSVEITSTALTDPKKVNDIATVIIVPQ